MRHYVIENYFESSNRIREFQKTRLENLEKLRIEKFVKRLRCDTCFAHSVCCFLCLPFRLVFYDSRSKTAKVGFFLCVVLFVLNAIFCGTSLA